MQPRFFIVVLALQPEGLLYGLGRGLCEALGFFSLPFDVGAVVTCAFPAVPQALGARGDSGGAVGAGA